MPITLSGTRITVEYQAGDAKGNSWSVPYTFNDIVAASTAGGWNPAVTKVNNLYTIPYSVHIIGAATYFQVLATNTIREVFTFCAPAPTDTNQFSLEDGNIIIGYMRTNGYEMTGAVFNIDTVVPDNQKGIRLVGNTVRIMASAFWHTRFFYVDGKDVAGNYIKHCMIHYSHWGPNVIGLEVDNIMFTGGFYGISSLSQNNKRVTIAASNYAIINGVVGNATYYYTGLKVISSILGDTYIRLGNTANSHKYIFLIDSEVELEKLKFYVSGTSLTDAYQYIQTSLNVDIRNEAGDLIEALVTLYDKDSNVLFSETATGGLITDRPTTYGQAYGQANGGVIVEQTWTDFQPLKIVISKAGYQDTFIQNINITKGVKTYIRTTIKATVPEKPTISGVAITDCTKIGTSDGQIQITVESGTQPFEYSLDGNTWQESNVFADLATGYYTVYVKDANGNQDNLSGVKIAEPVYAYVDTLPITGLVTYNAIIGVVSAYALKGVVTIQNAFGIVTIAEEVKGTVLKETNINTEISCN